MFNYKYALISVAAIGSLLTMLVPMPSPSAIALLSVFSLMWGIATYRHARDMTSNGSLYELAHLLMTLCFSFGLFSIVALIVANVHSIVEPTIAFIMMASALVYSIVYFIYAWIKLNVHPSQNEKLYKYAKIAFLSAFIMQTLSIIGVLIITIQQYPII